MSDDDELVCELYAELGVWEGFLYNAFYFDSFFFSHISSEYYFV